METKKGNLSWSSLEDKLHSWIIEALESLEFPKMTPVQASTIPILSGNKDVVVEAVTGSGKTLAFTIPVLQKVSERMIGKSEASDAEEVEPIKKGSMLAIVLAPTRELANQIQTVFEGLLKFQPESMPEIKTQLLIGSLSSVREDIDNFLTNRSHILIATPGRMMDFLSSSKIKTGELEIVILDEADKLLDISFGKDVTNILKRLPKQRRTGLFSATISSAGDAIFKAGMSNPVKVSVKTRAGVGMNAPTSLNLSYMLVKPENKITTLLKLLNEYHFKKCIVYFPTCTSVKYFYSLFESLNNNKDIKFFSLHGQLATKPRLRTLQGFSDADHLDQKAILMTTDVAARGIDIPDVNLVLQISAPTDPDVFLHRCGRTGRANKVGQAILMLNEDSREEDYADFMEVKGVTLNKVNAPEVNNNEEWQDKVRSFVLDDRARHELAVKSYVGFIKYYSKHIASSIFRLQSLDYIGTAKMFGLLRLPKMPETRFIPKESMPEDGWLGTPIDMDKYKFADEQREKVRIDTLEEVKQNRILSAKKRKELKIKNEAWSTKKDTKETKQERREKMKRKREVIEKQIMENDTDNSEEEKDWKDVVKENKRKKTSELQGAFDDL